MTTTGMNCTAWNSVRANAEKNSPECHTEYRHQHGDHDHPDGMAGDVEVEDPEGHGTGERCLRRGGDREGGPVPGEQVEFAERRGQQAFERAGRSFPDHRDRRRDEHQHKRQDAEHDDADLVEAGGPRDPAGLSRRTCSTATPSGRMAPRGSSRRCGGRPAVAAGCVAWWRRTDAGASAGSLA